MTPVISVIMPVYNCELYVRDALESILKQTFSDFELIIIDDCSTDSTVKIIRTYKDDRIKLFEKEVNSGYTKSLNFALSISKGQYIARMDGDDISLPNRFQEQVSLMENQPEIICCGSGYKVIEGNLEYRPKLQYEDILLQMIDSCPLAHPTVMIRKEVLESNKIKYNSDYEPAEDYFLWTELLFLGKVINIDEALLLYRVHDNQTSNNRNLEQRVKSDLIRRIYLSKMNLNENHIKILLSDKLSNLKQLREYENAESKLSLFLHTELNVTLSKEKLIKRKRSLINNNFHDNKYSIGKAISIILVLIKSRTNPNFFKFSKYIFKCVIHYRSAYHDSQIKS